MIFKWIRVLVICAYLIPVCVCACARMCVCTPVYVINFPFGILNGINQILPIMNLVFWIINMPKEQKQYTKEVLKP